VIVRDRHLAKAHKTLYSLANEREGLAGRVRIVPASQLTPERIDELVGL
jgi:hypothetical protein